MLSESDASTELWSGQPKQGLLLGPRDALLIPFSLAWCGFAVFWTVSATAHGAPNFLTLWGLMFVAIGSYFVIGRFFHDSRIRAKTLYSVTSVGIVIRKGKTTTSIPSGEWACLESTTFSDGTGTIRFAQPVSPFGTNGFGIWVPSMGDSPCFYRINDPDRVLAIIRGLTKR